MGVFGPHIDRDAAGEQRNVPTQTTARLMAFAVAFRDLGDAVAGQFIEIMHGYADPDDINPNAVRQMDRLREYSADISQRLDEFIERMKGAKNW